MDRCLSAGDRIVATADTEILTQSAPEAFARRGPWRFFNIVEISTPEATEDRPVAVTSSAAPSSVSSVSPVVELLRQATICRDQGDIAGARQALDQALQLAPDWEAVHYELGKFWLACDDMERARDSFQRATELMPTFAAAFGNLGATLGELDQPEAAVAAFSRALEHDPASSGGSTNRNTRSLASPHLRRPSCSVITTWATRDFCAVITRVRYRPMRKDNDAIPKRIAGRDAASPWCALR